MTCCFKKIWIIFVNLIFERLISDFSGTMKGINGGKSCNLVTSDRANPCVCWRILDKTVSRWMWRCFILWLADSSECLRASFKCRGCTYVGEVFQYCYMFVELFSFLGGRLLCFHAHVARFRFMDVAVSADYRHHHRYTRSHTVFQPFFPFPRTLCILCLMFYFHQVRPFFCRCQDELGKKLHSVHIVHSTQGSF